MIGEAGYPEAIIPLQGGRGVKVDMDGQFEALAAEFGNLSKKVESQEQLLKQIAKNSAELNFNFKNVIDENGERLFNKGGWITTAVEQVDFTLVETNAIDESYPNYSVGLNVKKDEFIIFNNKLYKAVADTTTTAKTPDIDIVNFSEFGYINSRRFCDEIINTTTDHKSGDLIMTIKPNERIDIISFLNTSAGSVFIDDGEFKSEYRQSTSWWEYFFNITNQKNDFHIKLNPTSNLTTIRLTQGKDGIKVGKIITGKRRYIGASLWGAEVSTISYTKKTTDEWGNSSIRKGKTAKRASYTVVVDTNTCDWAYKTLNKINENGLALFVGDERDEGFEMLTIYGIMSDITFGLNNSQKSELKITLEGVI